MMHGQKNIKIKIT